ncbi:MAG: outer membrane protein assembly factor [Bacteroidales bacterium]|jgi:hypothetical protein|nr:outer membrane protein assembly factor [Bacteroidales bacterium]
MALKIIKGLATGILPVLLLVSCNTTKFVPDGEYLLNSVQIKVEADNKTDKNAVKGIALTDYLKQRPNYKVFSSWDMRLGLYSLAGQDTAKWYNRFLKKIGQPPVIYNETLAENTVLDFQQVLFNKGYMDANVYFTKKADRKKMTLSYHITPRRPYRISGIDYAIQDDSIAALILSDTLNSLLKPLAIFDGNTLNEERTRIANKLRMIGYYGFTKENIHYFADSLHNEQKVKLTVDIRNIPFGIIITDSIKALSIKQNVYRVKDVYFLVDNITQSRRQRSSSAYHRADTLLYREYRIIQRNSVFRPEFLARKCFIRPHSRYSERAVLATYAALGSLSALQYANIRFEEVDSAQVNCFISLTSSKSQSVSVSLEGTNSAGDLGVAGSLNYQHRNIFKGSETLNMKLRGSYEALSGNISDIWQNRYTEIGAETSIIFPGFLFPFLSSERKRRLRASTEYSLSFGRQERPEYERIVFSGAWKYNWVVGYQGQHRHNVSPFFFDYVHIPRMSETFVDDLDEYPALLHSFEDHVIAGMSYSYYNSNMGLQSSRKSLYSIRLAVEAAGNLLYGISSLTRREKDSDGQYRLFDVPVSQYLKGDFDYARTYIIDDDNSLACHFGFGLAFPYLNAGIMPFEKRYYAGGANSLRGWSVRTVGPGTYRNSGLPIDYANQSGDIRIDMNIEWRTHIFWLLQLAGYVDAGNIWTIKDYPSQPGGLFKFGEFYRQIAASYGLGLRLDFNLFLLRFDMGMKAHDPSATDNPWVMFKPSFRRDFAFHFAIGYPF